MIITEDHIIEALKREHFTIIKDHDDTQGTKVLTLGQVQNMLAVWQTIFNEGFQEGLESRE